MREGWGRVGRLGEGGDGKWGGGGLKIPLIYEGDLGSGSTAPATPFSHYSCLIGNTFY